MMATGYSLMLAGKLITGISHREVIRAKDAVIADKDKQIDALTRAIEKERERGDAGILAAQLTREVMLGVRKAIE